MNYTPIDTPDTDTTSVSIATTHSKRPSGMRKKLIIGGVLLLTLLFGLILYFIRQQQTLEGRAEPQCPAPLPLSQCNFPNRPGYDPDEPLGCRAPDEGQCKIKSNVCYECRAAGGRVFLSCCTQQPPETPPPSFPTITPFPTIVIQIPTPTPTVPGNSPTPTRTPTPTKTPIPTPTPTKTPTPTIGPSSTPTPTATPIPTGFPSLTPTTAPTATPILIVQATNTPGPSASPAPTNAPPPQAGTLLPTLAVLSVASIIILLGLLL